MKKQLLIFLFISALCVSCATKKSSLPELQKVRSVPVETQTKLASYIKKYYVDIVVNDMFMTSNNRMVLVVDENKYLVQNAQIILNAQAIKNMEFSIRVVGRVLKLSHKDHVKKVERLTLDNKKVHLKLAK